MKCDCANKLESIFEKVNAQEYMDVVPYRANQASSISASFPKQYIQPLVNLANATSV